jgi:hypothetical protein
VQNQGEDGIDCQGPCLNACPPVYCTLANGTVVVCASPSPSPLFTPAAAPKSPLNMLPIYAGAGGGAGVLLCVLAVLYRRRVMARVKRSRVDEAIARIDGDPEDVKRQQALTRGPPGNATNRTAGTART